MGFRQFAGRGLRHVATWRGHWLALVGWQSGAFKCGPRDRWLGWHRSVQFRRLHLIANNTRFLVLPEGSGVAHLASRVLGRSLRRLSADWAARYGHPLELAETFVDPARFRGTCYAASNCVRVGRTKGFARHNGAYTDPHEQPKEMYVRALRRDARRRLVAPLDRAEWQCRATPVRYTRAELRSLRDLFAPGAGCTARTGPQALAADRAVGLRVGTARRPARAGGDGAIRTPPQRGGAAGARRVDRPGDRAPGRTVGLDPVPGADGH